jgi:hypothetical protein
MNAPAGNKFRREPPAAPRSAEEFVGGAPVATHPAIVPSARPAADEKDQVYKSVTLRLTKERYKALKMLSTTSEKSIQDLLTRALDALLEPKGEGAS